MDNLIFNKRAFVADQIRKSFSNDIEKARSGVYADTAENRKLGRVGQEYGHVAKQKETTNKQPNKQTVNNEIKKKQPTLVVKKADKDDGEKLIDNALTQMGFDEGHKFENRGKFAKQLSSWANKFGPKNKKKPKEMIAWLDDNMETLYNLDDMDMDELDEFSDFEGWDELNDIINEMSDSFENPPSSPDDLNDMIIDIISNDMGGLDDSEEGVAAQKKLVKLASDFVKKNPGLNLTEEDWTDIFGGEVDETDEKYGKLKGFKKLNEAIERFYDGDY